MSIHQWPARRAAFLGKSGIAVDGCSHVALDRRAPRRWELGAKRVIDLVGSVVGLILSAPLVAFIVWLIRADSPGPVLFSQLRVGAADRLFRIYKFRTMAVGAESRLDEIRHLNFHAHTFDDARLFKAADDPRVTRCGGLLRRYSLDELPQLVNVVKGEMSLVGPRPLMVEEDRHVVGVWRHRVDMRPGITGPWQVQGRNSLSFETMLQLDLRYVSGWRLRDDASILLRTIPAMLRRQEAP